MKNVIVKLIALFIIYCMGAWALGVFYGTGASTLVANKVALDNVNGGNVEYMTM